MPAPQVCLFADNAQTTIAGAITNTATSVTLQTGAGALFPSPGAGEFFIGSFFDAATGLITEIVHVTNVTGDTLTIVRAQEGTSAEAWSANDIFGNFITAGSSAFFMQQGQNFLADSGSANAISVAFLPAPASLAALTGVPIWVKKSAAANTAGVTVTANGFGPTSLLIPGGGAIAPGALPGSGIFCMVFDGTVFETQSQLGGGSNLLTANNTWSGTNTFDAQVSAPPVALGSLGATPSINFALGVNFTGTANANFTLPFPSNAVAGQAGAIEIVQDGTGSRTITYASGWLFAGGLRPVLSTTPGAIDVISYLVRPGATQIEASLNKAFA